MNCPKCNASLPDNAILCENCGAQIPAGHIAPAAQYAAPDGFTLEAQSGLYYRRERDPQTGRTGGLWFNPVSGGYKRVLDTAEEPPQDGPARPEAVRQRKGTRKGSGLLAGIVAAVLLIGGAGGHFLGLYNLPFLPEQTEAVSQPEPSETATASVPQAGADTSAYEAPSTPAPDPGNDDPGNDISAVPKTALDPLDFLTLRENIHTVMTLNQHTTDYFINEGVSDVGPDFKAYDAENIPTEIPGTSPGSATAEYYTPSVMRNMGYEFPVTSGQGDDAALAYESACATARELYGEPIKTTYIDRALQNHTSFTFEDIQSYSAIKYVSFIRQYKISAEITLAVSTDCLSEGVKISILYMFLGNQAQGPTPSAPQKTTEPPVKASKLTLGSTIRLNRTGDPYEEDVLSIGGTSATPDVTGGYNCSVTVLNNSTAVIVDIDYEVYADGDFFYEDSLTVGEALARNGKGTFYFEVPDSIVEEGDVKVTFNYHFHYN
jgi:hypothetical protein